MPYIAHIKFNDINKAYEHLLEEHLKKVGALAKAFAEHFGPQWAQAAGQWHDLGKYRKRFQDYIRLQTGYEAENAHIENATRAPHSNAGALHAIKLFSPPLGHILAYIIAGHHTGLPDWSGSKRSLEYRLQNGVEEYEEALKENIPSTILEKPTLPIPKHARDPEDISLWIRMLFSSLVDADFLDTEHFMAPDKAEKRGVAPQLSELGERFCCKMEALRTSAKPSALNDTRASIQTACIEAAAKPPGMFSLTVPTGGGKTLASLAFALEHARRFNKVRIIYAIPFTSIIEQNADVFRSFLGEDSVLEHHSNLDVPPEKENLRMRLAAENWDHPLVVTTNVQFFESLHAARTSRCRKLHNLVNSIIILDEAQQLPREFHGPITRVMTQLSKDYGVTWVLCTATQPVLSSEKDNFGRQLLQGLDKVEEIISDPIALAHSLKRVDVHMPKDLSPELWSTVAERLKHEDCVLAVVNQRKHAGLLYGFIEDDDALHLSANMCAAHRTQVISEIKERLKQRQEGSTRPMRVVSTQLVEAGVDLDFPVVFRALAGLDSIAQAAGRCNREGLLERGHVYVFCPEEASPRGFLRQAEDVTRSLLAGGKLDEPLSPESFQRYFSQLNAKGDRDLHGILDLLKATQLDDGELAIQFRTAAEKFRMIDETGYTLVVPYCANSNNGNEESPVHAWLAALDADPSQKWVYRKLQRYTVNVHEQQAKALEESGGITPVGGQWLLDNHLYDPVLGLLLPDALMSGDKSVI